jgi:hypothetical protein
LILARLTGGLFLVDWRFAVGNLVGTQPGEPVCTLIAIHDRQPCRWPRAMLLIP